jgi:hypothetical protein
VALAALEIVTNLDRPVSMHALGKKYHTPRLKTGAI